MSVAVSSIDEYIWRIGTAFQLILCILLARRQAWKRFPMFSLYVAYELLQSVLLMSMFTPVINTRYETVYWITNGVEYGITALVILELTRFFFRLKGRWLPGARAYLTAFGTGLFVLSAYLSTRLSPPHTAPNDLLLLRCTTFSSVFLCGLLAGTSWLATRVIRLMPTAVWVIWVGFVISSGSAMLQTISSLLFGWHHGDQMIDRSVSTIYLTVFLFWSLYFGVRFRQLQ